MMCLSDSRTKTTAFVLKKWEGKISLNLLSADLQKAWMLLTAKQVH